jgi:hypothetical protein
MRIRLMLAACLAAILAIPAAANAAVKQHPKPKKSHVISVKQNPRRCGERGGWEFNLNIKPYHVFVCNGAPGATGPAGPAGPSGQNGATGSQGSTGVTGTQGTNGGIGTAAAPGQNGQDGVQGPQGPAGPTGASAPFTYTYSNNHAPDSGDCGNNWATDSFDSEYQITPLADGSYLVVKHLTGSFTTIAGTQQPNDPTCSTSQTGGVDGTFQGVETWTIQSPGNGQAASFDPTASPDLSGALSNEAQNAAFTSAFFPGSTYSGVTNYDFVYHTDSNGSWVDSNTPANNTGNITG